MNQNLLTAKQVSDYLNIPLRTVQSLSKRGEINSFKVGGRWRYLKSDINKYGSCPTTDNKPNFLTAKYVSEFLGISLRTLYRISKQGKIKSYKIGGQWRYLESDITKCITGDTDFVRGKELIGEYAGQV